MKLRWGIVPFALSLVLGPGFGLVALGKRRRGYLWLAAVILALVMTALWFGAFLVAIALYVGAATDALLVGARREPPTFLWKQAFVLTGLAIATTLPIRMFALESFVLPAGSMLPTLEIGDHIFIDKLTPLVSPIRRGEVIVFEHPCRKRVDFVKRVVAVAGDTVEVRCDALYINGQAVPSRRLSGTCEYDDQDFETKTWFIAQCTRYTETHGGHTYDTFHDAERPERDARRDASIKTDFPNDNGLPNCAYDGKRVDDEIVGKLVETGQDDGACGLWRHYVVPGGTVFVMGDTRHNSYDSRFWGAVPTDMIKGRANGIWMSMGKSGRSLSRFGTIE